MKLKRRQLGSTGLSVSEISFGAGPVAGLLTRDADRKLLQPGTIEHEDISGSTIVRVEDDGKLQTATVERALAAGINWFDTAPSYGGGQSEINLGRVLRELGAIGKVHVATKVRVMPNQLDRIRETVRTSVSASLRRLGCEQITLLQLHNAITEQRGDQPNSITPCDVLCPGGILEAFNQLKADGVLHHVGLTGLGHTPALLEVLKAAQWASVQVPWNLLEIANASARPHAGEKSSTSDLLDAIAECGAGVIAIRLFAGGALAGRAPSAHTESTQYFPLAIYQQDQARAGKLRVPPGMTLKEAAVRAVLSDSRISTALIGFSNPDEIDEAVRFAGLGPLAPELIGNLCGRPMERTGCDYDELRKILAP